MPIYVYQCTKCNSKTEEIQKFTDPPLTVCSICNGLLEKQTAQRGAFHLKGSGWYKDSYHNPWGQGNNKFEDTLDADKLVIIINRPWVFDSIVDSLKKNMIFKTINNGNFISKKFEDKYKTEVFIKL